MPVFECHDCAELHNRMTKVPGYTGYGTCPCVCPTCENRGLIACDSCCGKGASGWLGRKCKECAGQRTVVCKTCLGFLAHPRCPVCQGTSCETCLGTRRVEFEAVLSKIKT